MAWQACVLGLGCSRFLQSASLLLHACMHACNGRTNSSLYFSTSAIHSVVNGHGQSALPSIVPPVTVSQLWCVAICCCDLYIAQIHESAYAIFWPSYARFLIQSLCLLQSTRVIDRSSFSSSVYSATRAFLSCSASISSEWQCDFVYSYLDWFLYNLLNSFSPHSVPRLT